MTMIHRRQFLQDAYVTLLLIPIANAACSSDTTPTTLSGDDCDGVSSTSTVTASHMHTVCVAASDLTSPPSGGATFTTSSANGHSHQITLTQAQLASIQMGQA